VSSRDILRTSHRCQVVYERSKTHSLTPLFPTPPYTISAPDDESDEEIVWILPELASLILKHIYYSYHEEIVGEIEYADYSYDPLGISHLSCLEECKSECVDVDH
jgi:hypothetical protein